MAYANSKIQQKIQQNLLVKLNRVVSLVSQLAPRPDQEEVARLREELEAVNTDLQYNSESAEDLLVKKLREKYNNFVEPQYNKPGAYKEYERQRRQRLEEIYAARQRIENNQATEEDNTRTDLHLAKLIALNNDPFFQVGETTYLLDIDGSAQPVQYDGEITAALLVNCVERDPVSQTLDLHMSLENCIDKAGRLGMSRGQLDKFLRIFVRETEELKIAYGSIRRLKGQDLFDAIMGLTGLTARYRP